MRTPAPTRANECDRDRTITLHHVVNVNKRHYSRCKRRAPPVRSNYGGGSPRRHEPTSGAVARHGAAGGGGSVPTTNDDDQLAGLWRMRSRVIFLTSLTDHCCGIVFELFNYFNNQLFFFSNKYL